MTEQFRAIESPQYVPYQQEMTLRDYFAGQALMGLCAFTGGTEDIYPRRFNDGVANECYQIADAMLEARKK